MKPTRLITTVLLVSVFTLSMPTLAAALTQFENPLVKSDPFIAINDFIDNIIVFILGFAAAVALASLIYGGLRLILGASLSESEIARAKQIIFWAIIGLVVIGIAGIILSAVRFILGLEPKPPPP